MRKALLAAIAAAALGAAFLPSCARAQVEASPEEQSFDYDPDAAGTAAPEAQAAARLAPQVAETTYEDAEMVNLPEYGTVYLSKSRWKNWVARAMYLALINIALIAVIISLPKTEEYGIIVAYLLTGMAFTVSLWIFLCALLLLLQLHVSAWTYVLPISLVMGAVCYSVLMKIKRSDISLAELKESFKKMNAAPTEDQRLSSVDGSPGDWNDQDFVK